MTKNLYNIQELSSEDIQGIAYIKNACYSTKYTFNNKYRYIFPKKWFEDVIFSQVPINKSSSLIICNAQFININKKVIIPNLDPNEIILVIFGVFALINKYFKIDYIIQVEYNNQLKTINLPTAKIFKPEEFTEYLVKNKDENIEKIHEAFLLYPSFQVAGQTKNNKLKLETTAINDESVAKLNLNDAKTLNNKNIKNPILTRNHVNNKLPTKSNTKAHIKTETKFNMTDPNIYNNNIKHNVYQYSLSSYKKEVLGPVGLLNPSVFCYINCCFQCLISLSELNYFFLHQHYKPIKNPNNKKFTLCEEYFNFLTTYKNTKNQMKVSKEFLTSCNSFLSVGKMQDCHEFLIRFLEALQLELNPKNKYVIPENSTKEQTWEIFTKYNNSFIDAVFTGLLSSKVHCTSCGKDSLTYDPFMDLSVPINYKTQNLKNCLDEYFKIELVEDPSYICGHCKQKTKVNNKYFLYNKFYIDK